MSIHAHSYKVATEISVGTALRWLAGIFLLALVAVLGMRGFFIHLQEGLNERRINEQARLFIGEEIVRNIQGLEKDFYRMSATTNAAGVARVRRSLEEQTAKLISDMSALEKGGTVKREISLNIGDHNEMIHEVTYQPDEKYPHHVLEMIELAPLLDQVHNQAEKLEGLLALERIAFEAEDRRKFFLIEEEVSTFLKHLPPYFERLNENANRLFFDSSEQMRQLEIELKIQKNRLQAAEIGLIGLVITLTIIAGTLFIRRIKFANQKMAQAFNQMRAARNENEQQRAQNEAILDTLNDGVYATDLEGKITFLNNAGETMLGWTRAELIGKPVHTAIHHTRPTGEHFPNEDCPLLAVLKEIKTVNGDDYFVTRDGRFVPVTYRSRPLFQAGEMVGSLVSFQDTTRHQEDEARIRLQQAALDAAANMIVITNIFGIIEYVNSAFCKINGYHKENIVGQHVRILNSGAQSKSFYANMWGKLLAGQVWEGELINKRLDGSIYQEQQTITPISNHKGISHFIAIKRDISEDARTKTRLKLIEAAIQNIDQGILISDTDLNDEGVTIEYANAGFGRITGHSPESIIGHRTGILYDKRTDFNELAKVNNAMREGNSIVVEGVYWHKDGHPVNVELQYSPVKDDNNIISHYIALLSDIGPRKQAENAMYKIRDQAIETSRLKSEFLSTMSHEIRTPMNGIIGMTDLLLDTKLDTEQLEFTRIVRDSAQSLLIIINDILDFSKIEAGKIEIEISDISLSQVVEGAIDLLAARAHEKHLRLMCFIDPIFPSLVRGDPMRLRQILVNIVGNAIKFTAEGEVIVNVTIDSVTRNIRFDIIDTGIGISLENQSKLFQSFTQAESSTTRRFGGTGLGLAISKRLVDLMDGDIGIVSTEGCGSTFWFTLPLLPATEVGPPSPQFPQRWRTLIADAQDSSRGIVSRYLRAWGLDCDEAIDADTALHKVWHAVETGTPYDLLLVHAELPHDSANTLAQAIASDPSTEKTRLLLLADLNQRALSAQARAAGFTALLPQPLHSVKLWRTIAASFDMSIAASPSDIVDRNALTDIDLGSSHAPPDLQQAIENDRLILLAEDNLTNQKVARLQLHKLGYAVHVVGNGKEAVDAYTTLPYAAILMDCQMPIMDGFEATATIRRAEQNTAAMKHLPIIAMTANAMQGDRERCIAAGMDDYISKPISPEALGQVLEQWVGHKVTTITDTSPKMQNTPEQNKDLIDFKRLEEYFGDDPETIFELLKIFLSSTSLLLKKLPPAIAERETKAVMSIAHEVKGSCSNIGIETMATLAAELERAASNGDWPQGDNLGRQLDAIFLQVSEAIAQQAGGISS
ncbi:MAG: PAS domain S-box protein [Burkholderiaceae bacterium]|nr:PAS domain S-box protein [Burkholderiaceae bacterium]